MVVKSDREGAWTAAAAGGVRLCDASGDRHYPQKGGHRHAFMGGRDRGQVLDLMRLESSF